MTGKILKVAHTGVTVSDLDRAIRFFGGVLGAQISEPLMADLPVFARITGVPGADIRIVFAELPGGHTVELLQYIQPAEKTPCDLRPSDPGHLHLALQVEGIEAVAELLRQGGFAPVGPVQTVHEFGGIKAIYTVGFDNIYVELMELPQTDG